MTNIVEVYDDMVYFYEKARMCAPNNKKHLRYLELMIEANEHDLQVVLSKTMKEELEQMKNYIKENTNVNTK